MAGARAARLRFGFALAGASLGGERRGPRLDVGARGLQPLGDAEHLLVGQNARPADGQRDRGEAGERLELEGAGERRLERAAGGQRAVIAEQRRVARPERLERRAPTSSLVPIGAYRVQRISAAPNRAIIEWAAGIALCAIASAVA